jgi:hypothetical protein
VVIVAASVGRSGRKLQDHEHDRDDGADGDHGQYGVLHLT